MAINGQFALHTTEDFYEWFFWTNFKLHEVRRTLISSYYNYTIKTECRTVFSAGALGLRACFTSFF
uniref:Uncharacterized protein n=1 Tax=Anguilla anguilla TaxID=7936 RepID=A0A0E9QST5_ANGAN